MQSLTDFADQSVLLPVAAIVALFLAASGWRRAAVAWACVVPGTLLTVLAGKLFASPCAGYLPAGWTLHSPSGHTASAALVCGALAGLLLPLRRRGIATVPCALVAAAVIGGSRLSLRVHSLPDVVAGAAIGLAGACLLVSLAGARPRRLRHVPAMGAILLAGALILHGSHLRAETWIGDHGPLPWPIAHCPSRGAALPPVEARPQGAAWQEHGALPAAGQGTSRWFASPSSPLAMKSFNFIMKLK